MSLLEQNENYIFRDMQFQITLFWPNFKICVIVFGCGLVCSLSVFSQLHGWFEHHFLSFIPLSPCLASLFLFLSPSFSRVDWWVEFAFKTLNNVVVQPNLSSNFSWARQHLSFHLLLFLSPSLCLHCSPFLPIFTPIC